MQKIIPLEPGAFYHIYNRGNNRENVFKEERNYTFFLQRYAKYIVPVAETYAYCLLKNHFHLLIRIRETPNNSSSTVSRQFSHLFNSYAKAMNKAYPRTGSLFHVRFAANALIPMLISAR